MRLRPALAGDAAFLADMLLVAFNWDGPRFTPDDILRTHRIAHYITDWPRQGDVGVVAERGPGQPVGAAWARLFPADDPGYGYVGPQVPEVTVGVVPDSRRQGVGGALLDALADRAVRAGADRLSLSVEDGNPAVHLYTARGFRPVGREGGSDTMLLRLDGARTGDRRGPDSGPDLSEAP